MDHNNSIEELFSQTLREVFPNVHLTTNEQNNNLLHHLVNATKNVKLIQSLPNTFVHTK
jgi:transglutaminase/protease-like cytokinesis protein 3